MVVCPQCGDSSGVQIAQDRTPPGEDGSGPRWRASCDGCGSEWAFQD